MIFLHADLSAKNANICERVYLRVQNIFSNFWLMKFLETIGKRNSIIIIFFSSTYLIDPNISSLESF